MPKKPRNVRDWWEMWRFYYKFVQTHLSRCRASLEGRFVQLHNHFFFSSRCFKPRKKFQKSVCWFLGGAISLFLLTGRNSCRIFSPLQSHCGLNNLKDEIFNSLVLINPPQTIFQRGMEWIPSNPIQGRKRMEITPQRPSRNGFSSGKHRKLMEFMENPVIPLTPEPENSSRNEFFSRKLSWSLWKITKSF